MRTLLVALLLIVPFFSVYSEEFRLWHENGTERTIVARLVGKDDTAETASLMLKNTKTIKMDIAKLSEEDQEYINKWMKPIAPKDQLTVRVVKSGNLPGGYTKELAIDIVAGADDVQLEASCECSAGEKIQETISAGETRTFPLSCHNRYIVRLYAEDLTLLDEETSTKKTGVSKAK
ncbi:MAG: hypothetical protein K9N23_04125 [Akkermansiaceae bacterium]|nr:hypothetical protein [Akkermansiaceae bacterium]MCF7730846.1 hypothetical protein [Akkermansiaceae bacterium]